jgi:hypothetical protein
MAFDKEAHCTFVFWVLRIEYTDSSFCLGLSIAIYRNPRIVKSVNAGICTLGAIYLSNSLPAHLPQSLATVKR